MDDENQCINKSVVKTSLVECVNKLVMINSRESHRKIQFGHDIEPVRLQQKRLKQKIFNALFDRSTWKKNQQGSISWKLLFDDEWDVETVCAAVLFRINITKKKIQECEKLHQLLGSLVKDPKNSAILSVLLALNDIKRKVSRSTEIQNFMTKHEREKIRSRDVVHRYGETEANLFAKTYCDYPKFLFQCPQIDYPLTSFTQDIFANDLSYYKTHVDDLKVTKSSIKGLQSHIFKIEGLPDSSFTRRSQETLYGGLVHSRTSSMNISLTLPDVKDSDKFDLCRFINSKDKLEDDEGFVSRGSTPSPKSTSSLSLLPDLDPNLNSPLFEDNEPYVGYRVPGYDIEEWSSSLTIKRSAHRTWETIGMFAGSTGQHWYLTEAGPQVFDCIWKKRWQIVIDLATALCHRRGTNAIHPPPKYEWLKIKESVLVRNSVLVTVGVASDTYQLNTLAHMFLANKKVHIEGVTAPSVFSVLSRFAQWGTCYWRLLRFSSAGLLTLSNPSSNQVQRGVIFKAFCDGIHSYLHGFQQNVLIHGENHPTLQQLVLNFEKLGSQIRYLCQLCKCGSPDSPQDHISSAVSPDFPKGVMILSYLYEEALHCTQKSDYMVLLYLLRKCCQPYLQFVQTWVFRGSCWDITGEFFLRVNVENGCRRDRRRWCNYIEASDPDNVASCVPTFLAPVANDILTCGKSIELLQLICPEHFLCTHLVSVPRILVTFSTTRMQEFVYKWRKFEDETKQLETERTTTWQEKEDELKESKRQNIVRAREFYEEQMSEASLERERAIQAFRKGQMIELDRLKKQAEHEKERKAQERMKEKEADALWIKEVADRDEEAKLREKNVLQEAKDEMIAHYEQLGSEAERRREKAEWLIRRHQLQQKRIEFHKNDVWTPAETDLQISNNPDPKEGNTLSNESSSVAQSPEEQTSTTAVNNLSTPKASQAVNTEEEPATTGELSSVDAKPVAAMVVGLNPPHVSQQTEQREVVPHQRQVGNQHISDSTVFSSDIQSSVTAQILSSNNEVTDNKMHSVISGADQPYHNQRTSVRMVEGQHPSKSTFDAMLPNEANNTRGFPRSDHATESSMQLYLTDAVTQPVQQRTTNAPVANQHVSKSSLGDIFQGGDNPTEIPSLFAPDHHVTDSTMQSYLSDKIAPSSQRTANMMVPGQHVSKSVLVEVMAQQDEAGAHVDYPKPRNTLNQHPCRSTVQDLMYYEGQTTLQSEQVVLETFDGNPLKPPELNHPSQSTVGKLLYPAPKTNVGYESSEQRDETREFSLTLPTNNGYENTLLSMKERFYSGRLATPSRDVEPFDLYGAVMGDFSGLYSNDDDIDDMLGRTFEADDDVAVDFHALPILLKNCVLRPIKSHTALVNRCIVNHFMADLGLPRHFETLRNFLLFEDGEFAQNFSMELFELVHSGENPSSLLNPIAMDSILTRAVQASGQRNSAYAQNLSVEIKSLPPAFSSTDLHVLNCIDLRYKVDWPCNIVLTDSSHTKYNRVMAFLLQLKHVLWALHDICKRLNKIACGRSLLVKMDRSQVRRLHICRHEMHNFVKVMQGYVSTQVLHVCWQEFQEALRNDVRNLDDLHVRHAEYINRCVLRCLLTPKAQNVMNVICDALKCILRFRAQLAAPASANFTSLHRTYLEFTRFSNFLFRVVSKLVERGYQPHLEDFLLRLNFNGYYKT
uniref:Gamma-tubulin complex component 6 n=1 Tax=Phallusia mammillata TaxID=59560 RepID=A0A6F9DWG3_9ASCI|nr:gamma-tubulin complex component 6 [Phallusia mammillata]